MRIVSKLLLYAAAIAALCWLLPQIAASFNRAAEAGSTAEAAHGYGLFAVYLLVGTALGLLVAWDVSRLIGEFTGTLFVGGGRLPPLAPVYWKVQRLRRAGDFFEAIAALREYFATHPRQWRLAVGIAEIYEHDLRQPLLAALEYQTILQMRLPKLVRPEVMLRLSACRLQLREIECAVELLQRVQREFSTTSAAAKATRRLARIEPALPR